MSVFTYPTFWWWLVPILATHLGAVLGAWTYYLAIELHWTKADEADLDDDDEDEEAEPLHVTNGHKAGFNNYTQNGSSAPPVMDDQKTIGVKTSIQARH